MVAKAGRAGRFLGCRAWPRCKGSRGVGDLGRLPGEHPVAATRRLALERLRHTARAWSADDREDAAAEAVAVAVAGGWADRPTAWTFVARHALRSLRGWQVLRGRRYSSRNPTTPTAGPALLARDPATGDLAPASPSDWIEWSAAASTSPDPEAALDLAREYLPILEAGLDREDGPALVARLVAGGWARLMEGEIAAGRSVAECAERTSHLADDEGITGAQFGFAVGVLVRVWKHGPDLGAWRSR